MADYDHEVLADHEASAHSPDFYVKIWAILLAMLVVSVAGPFVAQMVEHGTAAVLITLVTAFGIAVVKAYLVAKNFMHIDVAKRWVTYLVLTAVVFMLLFFSGTAPDVMKAHGRNWEKPAWGQHGADAEAAPAGHGEAAAHGEPAAH